MKYLLDNIRLNGTAESFRLGDVWFDRVPVSRKFDLLTQIDLLQSKGVTPACRSPGHGLSAPQRLNYPDRAIFWSTFLSFLRGDAGALLCADRVTTGCEFRFITSERKYIEDWALGIWNIYTMCDDFTGGDDFKSGTAVQILKVRWNN